MAKKLAGGSLAAHSPTDDLTPEAQLQKALYAATAWMVADAWAESIVDKLKSVTVSKFIDIIEEVRLAPTINGSNTKVGKIFTDILVVLNKMDPDVNIMEALKHEPKIFRALMNAYGVDDLETLKRLANIRGVANGSTSVPLLKLFERIGKIEPNDISGMEKGFKEVLNNFDTKKGGPDDAKRTGFNKSSGAYHEVIQIKDVIDSSTKALKGLQVKRIVRDANGNVVGERFYDLIVDENGVIKLIDSKAWSLSYIRSRLPNSMKPGAKGVDEANPGPLYRDIVNIRNLDRKEVIVWTFDKRASEIGEEGIFDMVFNAVEKNKEGLLKPLGIESEMEWEDFLNELPNKFQVEILEH